MCVAVMTCNRGLCCLVGAQLTAWRKRRQELGLSQQQVATKAKVKKSKIAALEGGFPDNPKRNELVAVARALRRPEHWLLDRYYGGTSSVTGGPEKSADDAIATRILELQDLLAARDRTIQRLEAKAGQITAAIRKLFKIFCADEETAAPRNKKAGSG